MPRLAFDERFKADVIELFTNIDLKESAIGYEDAINDAFAKWTNSDHSLVSLMRNFSAGYRAEDNASMIQSEIKQLVVPTKTEPISNKENVVQLCENSLEQCDRLADSNLCWSCLSWLFKGILEKLR